MPFKTDFLEGLILLYSNQISNCLLKKLSFQDSCTPHVKRKKTLSIPAFLYMVSSVPTFGTRDTNAWYERYHPLKFVVPMPGTSPTKGGIKLIPVRHRIQKGRKVCQNAHLHYFTYKAPTFTSWGFVIT